MRFIMSPRYLASPDPTHFRQYFNATLHNSSLKSRGIWHQKKESNTSIQDLTLMSSGDNQTDDADAQFP
jgi:hypothetical protein